MSYIQFESAREKEKARVELREAREQMLEQAKKRAEQRADRDASRQLKGETNWMLPSLEEKLTHRDKKKKKHTKKKKSQKKSSKKKKTKKKHKHQSSSEDDSSDSEESSSSDSSSTTSQSSSPGEERKPHKKSKDKKRKNKHKAKHKKASDSESDGEDEEKWVEAAKPHVALQRDSWMTETLQLKTFSREKTNSQSKEKQQIDTYDPAKSSRELNPYWKSTGTGLPAFKKPVEDDDDDDRRSSYKYKSVPTQSTTSKGWQKQSSSSQKPTKEENPSSRKRSISRSSSSSEHDESQDNIIEKATVSASDYLTDQQMNELGAKILKAEIMGNMSAAEELKTKLENARIQRTAFKERKKLEITKDKKERQETQKHKTREEHVILTRTDKTGHSRPLPSSNTVDPRDLYGSSKKKVKRVKTHDNDGQRVRYFADDDRYDIKQMFEREKYTTASEANLQFADLAAKNKNPNDDLEDIFADKICKDDSSREARKERDRAIREHQRMEAVLDNCEKCFDSSKMQKELLVSVGQKVYLALPWYQGLQSGHCIITPTQHSSCCTQLDEDTWTEISDFRKALTRMFAAQKKDVIFFEIANKLHRRPHLEIHCIPIKEAEGEMAPFYFKKAIEESEHEWSVNKQLVSLRNKSLRSCIPKGLPYFWVHFGMDTGFAHVIEDEERFPRNFAQEIIGGMLHLDPNKWRRLQKEQNIITKVKMFAEWWKKYDCTN
uniref:Cwf19-like C-terminal domain-containing protein n=1 Tax=Stomoxys calcitrans TaxID=35570 RepID=A0A1I8Q4H1_STOCA